MAELYKVPDEEKILRELEDNDEIRRLEEQLKEKREEIEDFRRKKFYEKIREFETAKEQMLHKLNDINNTKYEDTYQERYKIVEMKRMIEKKEEEERKLNEQLREKRREHELERMVRKKMELERIMEEKKRMNEEFKKIQTEIDVINEEKRKKDMTSAEILDRALKKGMLLEDQIKKGALSEQDKVLLAETYLQQGIEAEVQKERLLSEIQAKKIQENQKNTLDANEKMKSLNDLRFALLQKEEEILRQKAIHQALMKRGVDYLAEMELGHAPPRELIEKNIKINPEELRPKNTIGEVLERGKNYVVEAKDKIERLLEEQEKLYEEMKANPPYQGELKYELERKDPRALNVARFIIDFLFDRAWEQITFVENMNKDLAKKEQYYEQKQRRINRRLEGVMFFRGLSEIVSDILERVQMRMIREVAIETYKLNENAKNTALNIIMRALRTERNYDDTEDQLVDKFFKLRGPDLKKRADKYKFFFKDRAEIDERQIKTQRDPKKKDTTSQPKQPEEEIDYGFQEFFFEKQCVENIGEYRYRKLELDYFSKIELQPVSVIDYIAKAKGGITSMQFSPNGHYLALSLVNGFIVVLNVIFEPPEICLVVESLPSPRLRFSFDSSSQLLSVDQNFNVHMHLLNGNPRSKISNAAWLTAYKDPDLKPMEMQEYLKFDHTIFNRLDVKIPNEKDVNQIVFADFYPSFNLFGFHNSIIMGTKGGSVMKFNINKQSDGPYTRKQITKFISQPIISQKDPEFKTDILKADPKKGVVVSNPHVFREFFEAHDAEIMYIAFSESSDVFTTLDKTGRILVWNYETRFIRPDGTFQPRSRFKINLETVVYEENGARDQVFPPKKKLKGEELINAQLREQTEYEQNVMSNAFKFKTLDVNKIKDMHEYLIYKSKLPRDKEMEVFQFYTVDEANRRVKTIAEQNFRAAKKEGFIGHVEGSCNNRFLVIQLILPHKLRPQSSTVVFVGYKVLTNSLKKLKITVETPKTDRGIDFKVQDNFDPLGPSYIYLLLRDGLYIFSLATGLIVKIIKPLNTGLKNVFFDQMAIFQNSKVYFGSSSIANIWRFMLVDTNTQQAKEEALNERFEFLRLFNL